MSIKELLGIEYPVFQGAMAHIATGEFAAAVSNTGALGIIASGGMDPETLRQHIETCQSKTSKPFAVNLMLMNPHCEAMIDIIIDHGVKVVTTGAGSPGPFMEKLKAANIKVIPVVPSVALAKRMEQIGADAVVVEGTESGGHVGDLTTLALVPQVVDAISIPVVAAGGVASGRQMAAVLALGAVGVQIGTMLLVANECPVHESYKDAIIKAKDTDTVVTGRIAGVPVRILKNKMAKEYVAKEKEGYTVEQLEYLTLGSLRRAVFDGDVRGGSVMTGQVAGMVKERKPLKVIIETLIEETRETLEKMPKLEELL